MYPATVPLTDAEMETINAWYDSRYVCSNKNFVRFFGRVLVNDYKRYRELLRIEPGISQFDWLVQQYQESQTEETHTDETTTSGTTSQTTSGETTQTGTTSTVTHEEGETSGTNSQTITGTSETDGTTSVTENTETTTENTTGHSVTLDRTENQASGSDTTHSETDNNGDTKGLTKDTPMSISYQGQTSIPALNWEYPSGQTEQVNSDTSEIDGSTTYGRKDITTHTYTAEDTNEGTGTGERTNNTTTSQEGSTSQNTSGTTSGTSETDGTVTTTTTGGTETEGSASGTTSGTSESEREGLIRSISTGRSIDTATLLKQAKEYIQNTSAMMWLIKELEPCFFAFYDEDEEEVYI